MLVMENTSRNPWPCFMYSSLRGDISVSAIRTGGASLNVYLIAAIALLVDIQPHHTHATDLLNCSVPAVSRLQGSHRVSDYAVDNECQREVGQDAYISSIHCRP